MARSRTSTIPKRLSALKLTNVRLNAELLQEMHEARHALAKPTISDLVRDALRQYLDANAKAIDSYRKLRKRQ